MTQRIVLNDQPNEVVINPTTLDVVVDEVTTPVTIAASGPQGIPGAAGATGAQGPQGPQGDPGEPGVIAATAPILYDAPTQTVSIDDTAFVGSNEKGAALGVATLDANGLIPTDQLPGVAITNTFVVGSQAAMLLLTAETGDVAVRTDVSKSFILTAEPASTLGNWQELISPTDAVQSVDGRTGTVTLSDIYDAAGTAASAVSTHNSNTTSVHGITNTANLVYTGDARLSDARTPLAHASSHNDGGSDALAIDAIAATGSLRTLGTSATSAAAGNDARLTNARDISTASWQDLEVLWYGRINSIAPSFVAQPMASATFTATSSFRWCAFVAHRNMTVSELAFNKSGNDATLTTIWRGGLYTVSAGVGSPRTLTLVARTANNPALMMDLSNSGQVLSMAFDTAGGYPATYDLIEGTQYVIGFKAVSTGVYPSVAHLTNNAVSGFLFREDRLFGSTVNDANADLPTSRTITVAAAQQPPYFRAQG